MTTATGTTPLIELRGITRSFDAEGLTGVHDVDLKINRGDFIAIVGPSGAGKSTLLNLLGLLDRADTGDYLLEGVSVKNLRERERDKLRSKFFGFVFQSSFVLGDEDALHNAAMGLRIQSVPLRRRAALAESALSLVGLGRKAEVAARSLSGGERQRLAIARAVATGPTVVLADEPTGNLDTENGRIVIEHLKELNMRGTTVVIITHDAAVAAEAARQFRVVDGRLRDDTAASGRLAAVPSPAAEAEPHPSTRPRLTDVIADDLSDAVSAMTHRMLRTTLLVLAFALGVGGLTASIGISESASAQVTQRLTQAALDEVRIGVPGGSALLAAGDERLDTWTTDLLALPHVRDVGWVAQVGASSANIRRLDPADAAPGSEFQLITASDSYLAIVGATPLAPQSWAPLQSGITNAAIVGNAADKSMSLAPPGPGSSLWVNGKRVSVIGTVESGKRQPSIANTVIVSPDVVSSVPGMTVSFVLRTDFGYPATVAAAAPLALDAASPGQFVVETVADLRNLRFGVANDLGAFVGILSAILLVLATISATTTMYLSVQSRAHEIALRRAIGASKRSIGRLFVVEGILVGIAGGALGALAGTVAAIQGAGAQGWEPVLPAGLALLGVALGAVTGLLSTLVPAWAASRHEPADAIRG